MGRTGSGKSSLLAAITQLVAPPQRSGAILVGGVEVSELPLQQHRASLAVIPQEPPPHPSPTHTLSRPLSPPPFPVRATPAQPSTQPLHTRPLHTPPLAVRPSRSLCCSRARSARTSTPRGGTVRSSCGWRCSACRWRTRCAASTTPSRRAASTSRTASASCSASRARCSCGPPSSSSTRPPRRSTSRPTRSYSAPCAPRAP